MKKILLLILFISFFLMGQIVWAQTTATCDVPPFEIYRDPAGACNTWKATSYGSASGFLWWDCEVYQDGVLTGFIRVWAQTFNCVHNPSALSDGSENGPHTYQMIQTARDPATLEPITTCNNPSTLDVNCPVAPGGPIPSISTNVNLFSIGCSSPSVLKGNIDPYFQDDSGGRYTQFTNYPNFGLYTPKPIHPDEIPESCWPISGAQFRLSNYWTSGTPETVVGDTDLSGKLLIPFSNLLPDQQNILQNGQLLWVKETIPSGYEFAQLRCYMDARHGDNLEYIRLDRDQAAPDDVYCIAYNISISATPPPTPTPTPIVTPTVDPVVVLVPNYCTTGAGATVSWTISSGGQQQSAYRVQIDDNASFNSPEIDTNKINSTSAAYATPNDSLEFGKTYHSRVMVWNTSDAPSEWTNMTSCSDPNTPNRCNGNNSWTTPDYAYPDVDFTWSPTRPTRAMQVQFTDATVFGGGSSAGRTWTWDFGDSTTSTSQNPSKTYSTFGSYNLSLTARDAAGQTCTNIPPYNITIQKPVPEWKEVSPR